MSGFNPSPRSSRTPCWVGFVFCSPLLGSGSCTSDNNKSRGQEQQRNYQADVHKHEVFRCNAELKLPKRLHKWHTLNITNGAPQLQ
jgi:hypothetical protein